MTIKIDNISTQYRYIGILFLCVLIFSMLYMENARADFNTIAGKAEPNELGQLLIAFIGADGKPEEREYSVYYSGSDNEIKDIVFVGRTGHPASLVTGTYDVEIPVHPTLWIRGIVIESGRTVDRTIGGYGRILINGKNSSGKLLENVFGVFTHDDKNDIVVEGITNEPSECILAGIYDVVVNIEPRIIKESVRIEAGRDTILELPQSGRLEVRGKNAMGDQLKTEKTYIYKPGERESPSVYGLVNSPGELQPGIYDVGVDLAPEVWFEGIEIVSGRERIIDLPELGRLMVQGKDTEGVPLNGYGYSLYKQENSEKEIAAGDVNVTRDLLPGVYDVKIDINPDAWFKGIEIIAGKINVIDVPPPAKAEEKDESPGDAALSAEQGRIQILGKNARGYPLESYYKFYVYVPGDEDKSVAEESVSNSVDLPPGIYDVRVEFMPDIWFKSVEVVAGQSKQIELPLPGRLDVRGNDALGDSYGGTFYSSVYESGDREKPLANTCVNWHKDLPAGVYDIHVNLNPEVWYERVEITAGESRVINLPEPGRLDIRGTDAVGASRDVPFSVYISGEREENVIDGVVNIPLEIQPGVYDIRVDLETDETWFSGVEIVPRQSNILELSPPGRIWIYGKDGAGDLLSAAFTVYADGDKEVVVGQLNEKVDMPAGIYDVRIDLESEVWHKDVKIVGGQIKKIDLSKPVESRHPDETVEPGEKASDTELREEVSDVPYGTLEVRGKDAAGELLSGYSFNVYIQKESEERITYGKVNTVKNLPHGTYDVRVDLVPEIWYERVVIKEGETATIDLPDLGRLDVIGKDASGGPVSERFFVYNSGERDTSLALGEVNVSRDLQPGVYDIEITSDPPALYKEVEIATGQITSINLSQTGRLYIRGKNAVGEPLREYFFVYPAGSRKESIATGNVNEVEDLQPGTYDIRVALDPVRWYEGVWIDGAETTVIELPQGGRIDVQARDQNGGPLRTNFWVYAEGERKDVLTSGYTNEPLDIWAGTYDITVDLNPDVQFNGIEVTEGQTRLVDVAEIGYATLAAVPEEGAGPYEKAGPWYVYTVGADGRPGKEYIAVSYENPSGEFALSPGRYFAVVTVRKGRTEIEFEVKRGEMTEETVVVDADAKAKIRLEKSVFNPDEEIVVHFVATADFQAYAWAGIVPSHVEHGDEDRNDQYDIDYEYLNGQPFGSISLTAPQNPGQYDVRLHDSNISGNEVASVSFTVIAGTGVEGKEQVQEKEQEKVQDAVQGMEQVGGQEQKEAGVLYINSTFRIAVTNHTDWEMRLMPGSRVPEIKASSEHGGKRAFIDSSPRLGPLVLFLKKTADGEKSSGTFNSNILLAVHDITKNADETSAEAWVQKELAYTRKHFPMAEITAPPSKKDLNGRAWVNFGLELETTAGEKLELKQLSYVHLREAGGKRYIYVFAATALQSEFETDRKTIEAIIHSADLLK